MKKTLAKTEGALNIIIVGCGKVGQNLAEQLNEQGNNITVTFDRPTPLQIDGETVLDVTSYNVTV